MATVNQKCSKCDAMLTFASDAAVETPVKCPNGHRYVIAKCPTRACPAKRIAITSGSRVGKTLVHANECFTQLIVTSRKPTVLTRL